MVNITNKLRIMEGNIILIPSCEPISVVTHISNYINNPYVQTLLNSDICNSSYITLHKAMEIIPNAKIEWSPNYSYRWFVLPKGPPPSNKCPCDTVADYYKLLRENADGIINIDSNNALDKCSGFNFNWCK